MSDNQKIKDKIELLRSELEKHRMAYHVHDSPIISDEVYDSLMFTLSELEKEYSEFDSEFSPTKRVGGYVLDNFEKAKHDYKQWSFDNIFDFQGLLDWNDRNNKIVQKLNKTFNPSYMCELKIDGLKVILTYVDGFLIRAATRGDGEIGEDITENIKTIKTIPIKLKDKINITISGECWMKKADLENINLERQKDNLPLYSNTRNLAAGTLRQLDSSIVAKRKLNIFAYDIEGQYNNDQSLELEYLKELGFLVNQNYKLCNTLQEVEDFYKKMLKTKDNFTYGVDGMVIKVNQKEYWNDLGFTSKSPRAGIAYKFPADIVTTELLSVSFQVGRTGAITPVANLRPIFLSGSKVSRATLHNQDEIKKLDLKIGDTVWLRKAGDVIPEIFDVFKDIRSSTASEIIFPNTCPICNTQLSHKKVGKDISAKLYCVNPECDAKHIENLIHFVSKKAMNIDGLGEKIIEEFFNIGLLSDYASLYKLQQEDIENLFGYGKKSAENIIASIKNSREVKLNNFIYALGISNVGEVAAKDLSKYFKSLEFIRSATLDNILCINNFGPTSAESIIKYFNNQDNKNKINSLLKYIKVKDYIQDYAQDETITLGNLKDKVFVITGTLSRSRDYFKDLIEQNGGSVSSAVSSNTDYLLLGINENNKISTKEKSAKLLNIKIINEKDFYSLIKT